MSRPDSRGIMPKISLYLACLMLLPVTIALAEEKPVEGEPKTVSGMSVIGNSDETPKSLYIVPWKVSDVGEEVTFTSSVLREEWIPVDKIGFMRQLDIYRKINPN